MDSGVWARRFVRDENVVSRNIAGERVLVPIRGRLADMGNIFTITAVAEYIWDRLDGERSLGDIRGDLLSRFEVGAEEAGLDMQEFVDELLAAGLIHEKTA